MIRAAARAAFAASLAVAICHAEEEKPAAGQPAAEGSARWTFAGTLQWSMPKGEDAFATPIVAADRGALHLEARANYEALHAQSAFLGWTFSTGGDAVKLDATPLVGGVAGATRGPIGGVEATATAGAFDAYIEAEHVHPNGNESGYTYAWTELGWRPSEWLRLGGAGQHTRVYGEGRGVQRGAFVQLAHANVTLTTYWFDPGASTQLVILSVGVKY